MSIHSKRLIKYVNIYVTVHEALGHGQLILQTAGTESAD